MLDLSGKTMAELLSSMLLGITEQVNKREGSLIRTALSAAAWAIEGLYIELIDVQKQAYATTATGEYLDLKAAERGVVRIEATNAVYELLANLSNIPLNFQFSDTAGNTWNVTSGVISGPDQEGLYTYYITCQTAGAIPEPTGNLNPLSFLGGLTTARFGNSITPGSDTEDDESLRERYEESLVEIAFAGNIAAYREKILETTFNVGGGTATVEALQVYPETAANGSQQGGSVKIYIVNSDYETASQQLIDAVKEVLDPSLQSGYGYGFAPIGAHVIVASSTTTPVLRIDVTVTLAGVTLESVIPVIKSNILEYVRTQKKTWSNQVQTRLANSVIAIREAFIYAASLVNGVSDVTSVVLYKDGVVQSGHADWVTSPASMEWITDEDITINVTT